MSALPARVESISPAEVDKLEADALAAIDGVREPEAAEALLARVKLAAQAVRLSALGRDYEQRWGRVRLLAERRYGELLGPADRKANAAAGQHGVSGSDTNSGAEREAQRAARKLAAVPDDVFTAYIETADEPTRAGLLRNAAKHEPMPEPEPDQGDLSVISDSDGTALNERDRQRANKHRERIATLVNTLDGMCQGLERVDLTRATMLTAPEEITEWVDSLQRSMAAVRKLQSTLKGFQS